VSPEVIRSDRLDLVWLSPELIQALLDGRREETERTAGFVVPADWPDDHDARCLAFRLKQAREDPTQSPWLVRAMVLRGPERLMVGNIGFHGSPGRNARKAPDAVEIGYRVFADHRRRGYATEAVRALLDWARGQGIDHFVASVRPENEPSLAIVRQLGFREVGRHWDDEDGEELEFELAADAGGPPA
jgi:ribosomal-protein-alanine N-acetyltransferase